MNLNQSSFLDLSAQYTQLDSAAFVILPVAYEAGVSYGCGASKAPEAIIDASSHVELFDEIFYQEPYLAGISTLEVMKDFKDGCDLEKKVEKIVKELIAKDKFVILLGGDHSVTPGFCKAYHDSIENLGIIQLDAHADLRTSFENDPYSHACTMSRIREFNQNTLQLGIRAMAKEEYKTIVEENISLATIYQDRKGLFNIDAALAKLPENVFLTIDVDVFSLSVIPDTGTPEPGGYSWGEGLSLLKDIFFKKNVVGFDVVELSADTNNHNSAFAVARLIYKLIGFQIWKKVEQNKWKWPIEPKGSLFPIKS